MKPNRISQKTRALASQNKDYWYDGPMDLNKMDPIAKKAFRTWKNQISRCYHQSTPSFKTYGAMGIEVEYLAREFVGWYLMRCPENCLDRSIEVGRIDHSKNYSFKNIEFVTKAENSREMLLRTGNKPNKARMKKVVAFGENGFVKEFPSIGDTAKELKLGGPAISRVVSGKYKQTKGYRFKYL